MRVALVHDWFNQRVGGAERVAFELARLYPEAPIYTLIFNQRRFGNYINPDRVRTSFLQKLPPILLSHPRYLLPLIPMAVSNLKIEGFDAIISSSLGFAKNIKHPSASRHICYCHSPMRFAWDYRDQYLTEQKLDPIRRFAANNLTKWIRQWDLAGNEGVDTWLANSQTVANRIEHYYSKTATVVYPPIDTDSFKPSVKQKKADFYITVSMLTPYKKIDLVIKAFNQSGRRLIVLGDGPARNRLVAQAAANIEFLGFVSELKKKQLLRLARGLVFPNEEDFGIAIVEAMAAGTPVIAYAKGGATETIIDHETGILFKHQTTRALNRAVDKLEATRFSRTNLLEQASKFDASRFDKAIKQAVAGSQHVNSN